LVTIQIRTHCHTVIRDATIEVSK